MATVKNMAEFDKLIGETDVVMVDFFATWCGPCQMMTPVVAEIEEKFAEEKEIKILKVDIDENPDIAAKFDIMSVPTFLITKKGKVEFSQPGALPKEMLVSKIEEIAKKND